MTILGPALPEDKNNKGICRLLPKWMREMGFEDDDTFFEEYPYTSTQNNAQSNTENNVAEKPVEIADPEDIEFKDVFKKTGYDHLYFMCKKIKNNYKSWNAKDTFMLDNRATYIIDQLNQLNVIYKVIPFNSGWSHTVQSLNVSGEKMTNIQVFLPATVQTNSSIVFTAHYDIVNNASENCQDNTASVCNLLDLCRVVSLMDVREQNVYIVFTDGEECGGKGAKHLSTQINGAELGEVSGIISLELTANGSEMWAEKIYPGKKLTDNLNTVLGKKVKQFMTPYNEAISMRTNGLDAICIGILPPEEIKSLERGKWSQSWGLCHSKNDTFELSARRDNMSALVEILKKLINLK